MRNVLLIIFCGAYLTMAAQPPQKISRAEYIAKYKQDAIEEMHRSGVPASITLAQGILESGDGNSALARNANNHFGIKCHSDWSGPTYIQDDDEKDECFRKYKNVLASYRDHSDFLKKKRYAFLFELKPTDYKGWAKGLKKAGYATNPKYPELLIGIIERNELNQYDQAPLASTSKRRKRKERKTTASKPTTISKRRGCHATKMHPNNIRYIEVKSGDQIEKIAEEFNMGSWQLYKYNDLEKGSELYDSGVLFLQPKRGKAKQEFHTVEKGEDMWSISQLYGIKLHKLYRKNRMKSGDQPKVGEKLYLRKVKPLN